MRRIMAVAAALLVTANLNAQADVTTTDVRVVKVAQTVTGMDVVFEFTFDTDISKRVSEFGCECSRKAADATERLPVRPGLKPSGNVTVGTVAVPASDLMNVLGVECVLTHGLPSVPPRPIMTVSADLALRREALAKAAELTATQERLDLYLTGVVDAQRPSLQDVTPYPTRATVRVTGTPCGRYELRATTPGETPRMSRRSSPGSSTHVLEVPDLTSGKTYDIEFYQLNAADQPIATTRVTRTAGIITPAAANRVAFTGAISALSIEGGFVVTGRTNVPAAVTVDVREHDRTSGRSGTERLGHAWPQTNGVNDRPAPADLQQTFRVPIAADSGKAYQYRIRALNADGVEATTDWGDQEAVVPLATLGFTQPVEIAVTPVGFVVTWESSVVPDEASLTVDYEDRQDLIARADKPKGTAFSLALDPASSADFLRTMLAARQQPTATPGTPSSPAPKPPKLVVYMKKDVVTPTGSVTRIARQELRILLPQEKAETKNVMAALALNPTEKARLITVAEQTIEGMGRRNPGLKFNWKGVFTGALRLLLGGVTGGVVQ